MIKQIAVETFIHAPIEKIWGYWTQPEHIQNWCHASDDWHAPHAINDLKIGGKFKTRMESKDGTIGFDFEGIYTAIEEYKIIEYVMNDGRKVRIEFISHNDGYIVREIFDPENINPIEMQKTGWQAIIDNFQKYTEKI